MFKIHFCEYKFENKLISGIIFVSERDITFKSNEPDKFNETINFPRKLVDVIFSKEGFIIKMPNKEYVFISEIKNKESFF